MKKRIVALVLAAVLIMSMFAAQVFAADISLITDTAADLKNLPFWVSPEGMQGEIKVVGTPNTVYTNLRLQNGQALDFTDLGGGMITYKAPEYSGLSDVSVWAVDGILTVGTPEEFHLNVKKWVVTNVDINMRSVELSALDYDYDINVSGKQVAQWTRITAYETINFGIGNGTLVYYEDETSTIPLLKSEGAKSYKLGFGNFEDKKILAWTVRKCDPFHNVVEVCPYGLGGTRYTLLDSGRTPLYIGNIYAGMCIEVGASISISTEYVNDIDIRYYLPNNGRIEKSIGGAVVNVPSPGSDYNPIKYWIVTHVNSTLNTLELQPLYDAKPSFDYYYPTDGGTKDNPWLIGKYDNITAYVENGTLYLNGEGDMTDYIYGMAPWVEASSYVIKNLVVGEGITSLGIESFRYLKDLENVSLPSTLTSIKKSAFAYCSSLKYIEIPSGVHTIGYSAFLECKNLKEIKVGIGLKTVQADAFDFAPIEKVEYEGTEADWKAINIDLSLGHNDSFVNAEKTFGSKSTNASASIMGSVNSINTVILAVTAGVICVCAIICTAVYVRKNSGTKQ